VAETASLNDSRGTTEVVPLQKCAHSARLTTDD